MGRAGWSLEASSGSNKKHGSLISHRHNALTLHLLWALLNSHTLWAHWNSVLMRCVWHYLWTGDKECQTHILPVGPLHLPVRCPSIRPYKTRVQRQNYQSFQEGANRALKPNMEPFCVSGSVQLPRSCAHKRGPGYREGRWSHLINIKCLGVLTPHCYFQDSAFSFKELLPECTSIYKCHLFIFQSEFFLWRYCQHN